MGLCLRPFKENGEVKFPRELIDIFKKPNIFTEIIYPIQVHDTYKGLKQKGRQ